MIYLAPFVLIAPLFLLLFGARVSAWIRARQQTDPNAWIDARIASERNPARRAAWRMIRTHGDLENL